MPVTRFSDLIAHLGTLAANNLRAPLQGEHTFTLYTRKAPLHEAASQLLGIDRTGVQ